MAVCLGAVSPKRLSSFARPLLFFSVVFGTFSLLLFYLICLRLGLSQRVSLLATLLLALENMTFVQASVAMLDVYSLALMLAAFWLYLEGHYPLAGLFVGLSTLAKPVGGFALGVILLHWLYVRRDRVPRFLSGLLVAPISIIALLPLLDYLMLRRFVNPLAQIKTMAVLTATMTFGELTNSSQSRPWVWLLRPNTIVYSYTPKYLGALSYTVWVSVIPVIVYMVYRAARMKDGAAAFAVAWFIGTYVVLIPLVLISDRVTYGFYFYPTIGAICLGLGIGLSQLVDVWRQRRTGKLRWVAFSFVSAYLVAHVVIFALVSPMSYWLGALL
jgi:predicted membrane-bound dolichyl-phosphate-mannose-protein mannosyltransferase